MNTEHHTTPAHRVILYEVFTGKTVFECTRYCDSDQQHLQQMERRLGQFPKWAVDAASSNVRNAMFDYNGMVRKSNFGAQTSQPVSVSDPELQDLINRLLRYDPVSRIRADEVLNHPFVVRYTGPAEIHVHSNMPPNCYSAGYIRTPGCSTIRGGGRAPANKLDDAAAPQPRVRSSSFSASAGAGRVGALSEITNRPPAGMPSGLKRVQAAGVPSGRPRAMSGSAGVGGLCAGVGNMRAPTAGAYNIGTDYRGVRAAGSWLYR